MHILEIDEFILRDVYLYGLDEESFPGLSRMRGARLIGSSRSSVMLDEALFIPFSENGVESGRYQSVISGVLYTADGMIELMEVVMKIPKVESSDAEEARALALLEAEKADRFQEFGNIFALPLGHATIVQKSHDGDVGILDGEICNIQGRISGKTLLELFYAPSGDPGSFGEMVVDQSALWEFFEERDPEDVWLACKGEGHMPFPLVLGHIFLDIAEALRQLESMGLQHNDISPSNIMWSREKGFKLIDLALVSELGSPLFGEGTAPYAPFYESSDSQKSVNRGTDIRALYAICWELLGYELKDNREAFADELGKNGRIVRFASDAVIERIIDDEGLEDGANAVEEIAKVHAKDVIKDAQRRWYAEFCDVLLCQDEREAVNAQFAWERTDKAMKRLKANVRSELIGKQRKKNEKLNKSVLFILLIASLVVAGISNVALRPSGGFLPYAAEQAPEFFAVSVVLSILPLALGIFVDSAIAWRSYVEKHPGEVWSLKKYQAVAKYGDLLDVIDEAGRFDPGLKHCVYFGLCNILGASCNVSLLFALFMVDGFGEFAVENAWLSNWAMLALPAAALAAWATEIGMQSMPKLSGQDESAENPDMHAFTRLHAWGNVLHLIWTFFWVILSCVYLVEFLCSNLHSIPCQPILTIPILLFAAFVLHASVSDRALSVGAEALGSLQVEALVLVVVPTLIGFGLFEPTYASFFYLAISIVSAAAFLFIRGKLLSSDEIIRRGIIIKERDEIVKWVDRSKRNRYVTIAVIAAVFGLAFATWSLGALA